MIGWKYSRSSSFCTALRNSFSIGAPCADDLGHLGIEEPMKVSAHRFCTIERHVGHLQEFIRVAGVLRRERNPDAGANVHLVALDIVRLGNDLDEAACKLGRGLALIGIASLNDGELVAAESANSIGFPQRSASGAERLRATRHRRRDARAYR